MSKTMGFTVQMPENGKPTKYLKLVSDEYKLIPELSEWLIRDWLQNNNMSEVPEDEIKDLAYLMRKKGWAWCDDNICFELTEVNG